MTCPCPPCSEARDYDRLARRHFKKSAVAIGLSLNLPHKDAAEIAERVTRRQEADLPRRVVRNCWMRPPRPQAPDAV